MRASSRLGTVRARLTLWNVGVLALVLLAFGGALRLTVERNLTASIDRDIAGRARRHQMFWSRLPEDMDITVPPRGPWGGPPGGQRGEARRGQPDQIGSTGPGRPPDRGGAGPGASASRPGQAPAGPRDGPRGPRNWRPPGGGPSRPEWQERAVEWVYTVGGQRLFPPGSAAIVDHDAFQAATHGREVYSTVTLNEQDVRVFTAPLRLGRRIAGVVQVTYSLGDVRRATGNLDRTLLTLIPLALAAAALGGLFLTGRMLRPLRQATQTASRIGAEDLSRRMPAGGADEFGELATTFNSMLGRLEQAFEQQRRFTADASHELRTPLTVIKATTSLALSREEALPEHRKAMQTIDRAATTMSRLVQDLLLLARSDAGQLEIALRPTPLVEAVQAAVECAAVNGGPAVRNTVHDPTLVVEGDATYLSRLVSNLLENALRHTPADGDVSISAARDGDRVVVTVADTGAGIAPEHLPHICERFYRVDTARSRAHGGTGLGLAICQSIVHAHGGTLDIESEPGKGTTVTVGLQAAKDEG